MADEKSVSANDAAMYRLAFRVLLGVANPPDGMALCVSIGRDPGSNTAYDPPAELIARLTPPLHAAYPASQCVMDTRPVIARGGEQAQWYHVWVKQQRGDGSRLLVLVHIYGNLGSHAWESVATPVDGGWQVSQQTLVAIS
ncbi:hypothetical protein [Paraurantiacibacter namhicola]|uniref:hypothetical protein n=1 Tax=Paraurantiacibacter namhicola TaxID=645517 RepID=UPI00083779BE|nr:hypothetical protein [Paraurantiacibacter namhicola]